MIEKRQEITGNATRKPLRPLMTSCKADPPQCMRRKSKVGMPMEMEMGKCMSHGVFRSETSRLGDVRNRIRIRRDVKVERGEEKREVHEFGERPGGPGCPIGGL